MCPCVPTYCPLSPPFVQVLVPFLMSLPGLVQQIHPKLLMVSGPHLMRWSAPQRYITCGVLSGKAAAISCSASKTYALSGLSKRESIDQRSSSGVSVSGMGEMCSFGNVPWTDQDRLDSARACFNALMSRFIIPLVHVSARWDSP